MSATTLTATYLALKDPAVKYSFIEKNFVGYESFPMPMSLRKLIQTQLSEQTRSKEAPLGDNRSTHIKPLMAGTVGAGFTLAARIVRIVAKTIFFVPAIVVRNSTASRYGVDGAIKEFVTRYGEEWLDLGVTLGTIPIGLVKSWKPDAFSGNVDYITKVYLNRADRIHAFNEKWEECQKKYEAQVKASAEVRAR